MNPRIIIFVSVFLFAIEASACGDSPVYSSKNADGATYGLFLSDSDFESAPDWAPEDGDPPVSISLAVGSATSWDKSRYSRYDSFRVSGIQLVQYRCSSRPPSWYYKIDLSPFIDGNRVYDAGAWVAVLFNGNTVGPKKID